MPECYVELPCVLSNNANAKKAIAMAQSEELLEVDNLLKLLEDAQTEVRQDATQQLASLVMSLELSEEEKVPLVGAIVKRLRDEEIGVRREAAYALGWLNDEVATDGLLQTVANEKEDVIVRGFAAEALSNLFAFGDQRKRNFKRAATALTSLLSDPAPEVRFWASFALGNMRYKGALPQLERLAASDTALCPGWWSVQDEASDALTAIHTGSWPDHQRLRQAE